MSLEKLYKFYCDESETSLDSVGLLEETRDEPSPRTRRHHVKALYFHIVAIVVYALVSIGFVFWASQIRAQCPCNGLIYSPAREAIEYEKVTMINDLTGTNPFRGNPRPEQDDAWREILKFYNLRVTGEDLQKINRTSVPLNDEKGGYLVTLDVFHELHCLNMLREFVYRDYYPDKHTMEAQIDHLDHCIDLLRQVLMCHSDISLHTYGWKDGYRWPWPDFTIEHECRSWDHLMVWAEEHNVPDLTGPIVQHPTLGVSWRGDELQ